MTVRGHSISYLRHGRASDFAAGLIENTTGTEMNCIRSRHEHLEIARAPSTLAIHLGVTLIRREGSMEPSDHLETFRFGNYLLDPQRRKLTREGNPVELGSRSFDLLVLLVRARGQIVSKNQILDEVWPNLIVDETNLRFQISRLRKELSQSSEPGEYIKSVAGRGYVFVAPVTAQSQPSNIEEARSSPESRTPIPTRVKLLFGREENLNRLHDLLLQARFVSIVGSAGMGKTTAAIELAHRLTERFGSNIFFVDLGLVGSSEAVLPAIAGAVSFSFASGDLLRGLVTSLERRQILLILDCCEHVLDAVSEVTATLVREAPSVFILATSREPLRALGENVYALPPLMLPEMNQQEITAAQAMLSPTVQLFMTRARECGFGGQLEDEDALALVHICHRLEGNPLAIELAASRVKMYGFSALLEVLDNRLFLSWPGLRHDPRHATLGAALDWSFALLSELEQRVLTRLSIFVGTFSLEAAVAVCRDLAEDQWTVARVIEELVDKSLLSTQHGSRALKYRLLDVTRIYAEVKLLESGERDHVAERHAGYFLGVLQELHTRIDRDPGDVLEAGLMGNVRAALEWCFSASGSKELGIELAAVASRLFIERGLMHDCVRWCQTALAALGEEAEPSKSALLLQLSLATSMMYSLGNVEAVGGVLDRGLQIAFALRDNDYALELLAGRNLYHTRRGEFADALKDAERFAALARKLENPKHLVTAEYILGIAYNLVGKQDLARKTLESGWVRGQMLGLRRLVYCGYDTILRTHISRVWTAWLCGFPEEAATLADQVLKASARDANPVTASIARLLVAQQILWSGDREWAQRVVDELMDIATTHDLRPYRSGGRLLQGKLLLAAGDVEGAIPVLGEALQSLRELRVTVLITPGARSYVECLATTGKTQEAEEILLPLIQSARSSPTYFLPELLRTRADLLVMQGRPNDEAESAYEEAIAQARDDGALAWELRATKALARHLVSRGNKARAQAILQDVCSRFAERTRSRDLAEAEQLLADLAG